MSMPRCLWHKCHGIGALIVVVFLSVSVMTRASDPVLNSRLLAAIDEARTAKSYDARLAAANHIVNIMMGIDARSVNAKTVDELVSLLKSPDYEVRQFATIALGQLGRKARKPDPILNRKLEKAITSARTGKSLNERLSAGERLCDLQVGIDPMYVADTTIADMISLLNSPDDGVRGWVAAALGFQGPRAKAAVPKLLALLPAADCLQADVTSAGAIRLALKRIGVHPPPYDPSECRGKNRGQVACEGGVNLR